ncbi:lamin tail domain-containing protein [Candidatus Falkowbacteria bacterium]|nr:lamin tail domain-containing protein [Candidatus Falkowbacteria bacterium]
MKKKICIALLVLLIPAQTRAQVQIVEIYAQVIMGPLGDADKNGIRQVWGDEFAVIINTGLFSVDISFWTITDGSDQAFTFPSGTIIEPGERIVVFGGGNPPINPKNFAGIKYFQSDGQIGNGLNDNDDIVVLRDSEGNTIHRVESLDITGGWNNNESVILNEFGEWVGHHELPGIGNYSPGIAFQPPGDVSGNGTITSYDAAKILRHSAGIEVLTGNGPAAAEVSGDGTVSPYDASYILRFVVNEINVFPNQ